MKQVKFHLTLLLALTLAACGRGGPTTGLTRGVHPVPNYDDQKADNYISTNAREFMLTGEAQVTLPADFDELDSEAHSVKLAQLAQSRLTAVNRAIKSHIEKVVREANGTGTGKDASFFTYFKRNSAEAEKAQVYSDGTARFPFNIEFVGSPHIMSKLAPGNATRRTFDVDIDSLYDDEKERITVEVQGSESRDAFPRYNALFADGVFDMAIHFGGDYNSDRHDLETVRWTVEHLLEKGWENRSVSSFDDLKLDSPPFTRTITVEGEEIEVKVYLYHADMVPADQEEELSKVMKESFAERDVVIYSGHAGEGAGFLLDYHPRYELKASEFAGLPLADKYQIYVFDGCQTYRTYVDDMMKNPRKAFDNLDIITTVNTTPFAVGYQLIYEFLYWFTFTDDESRHFPLSWKTILQGLNTENYRDVHYGVHGIDGNPRLNPHAHRNILCKPCESDADCGAGGNFCLGLSGGNACGVACTTDSACGDGYRCARITDDPDRFYLPKQCIPRDYSCR